MLRDCLQRDRGMERLKDFCPNSTFKLMNINGLSLRKSTLPRFLKNCFLHTLIIIGVKVLAAIVYILTI